MQARERKKKMCVAVMFFCLMIMCMTENVCAQGKESDNFYFEFKEGSKPVVVLDAPYGKDHFWTTVLADELKKTKQVNIFQYDRAGLGKSKKTNTSRTPINKAKELHMLLKANGIDKFYYAGYALSGLTIRAYAYLYPGEVLGTVMMDCLTENQIEEIEPFLNSVSRPLMEKFKANFKEEGSFADLKLGVEEIKKIKKYDCFRNIPLTVISGDYHGFDEILRTGGCSDSGGAEMEKKWNDYQAEIAEISDESKHITLNVYSHFRKKTEAKCILEMMGIDFNESDYIDEPLLFSEGVYGRNLPLFRFFSFVTDGLGW